MSTFVGRYYCCSSLPRLNQKDNMATNLSAESTTCNRDRRPSSNMTQENKGIGHKKSLELCRKKKRSEGNHYQVDQRSYPWNTLLFLEKKRIL